MKEVRYKNIKSCSSVSVIACLSYLSNVGYHERNESIILTLKKWLEFQSMIFMLFVAHYFGCLWFAVGTIGQRDG